MKQIRRTLHQRKLPTQNEVGTLPIQNTVRKTMTFQEIRDHDSEVLCGGGGNNNTTTTTTTTTKYNRYAYAYQSRYSNNATQNVGSFNVSGGSSGAVLIGYQAGYTQLLI
jgi:hypothetical protein